MAVSKPRITSRRDFIGSALVLSAAVPLAGVAAAAAPVRPDVAAALSTSARGYRSLDDLEAAFVEAMVNALCPHDALTPDGTTSGLASFIDACLEGEVDGVGPAQRQLFRSGMSAVEASCRTRLGVPFSQLSPMDARRFLNDVAAGRVEADFPLASWKSEVVDPMLQQACFSGNVYATYNSRMFVKLFG